MRWSPGLFVSAQNDSNPPNRFASSFPRIGHPWNHCKSKYRISTHGLLGQTLNGLSKNLFHLCNRQIGHELSHWILDIPIFLCYCEVQHNCKSLWHWYPVWERCRYLQPARYFHIAWNGTWNSILPVGREPGLLPVLCPEVNRAVLKASFKVLLLMRGFMIY